MPAPSVLLHGMKTLLLLACSAVCVEALGALPSDPFPAARIEAPPLGLLEAARPPAPGTAPAPALASPAATHGELRSNRQRLISRMPVIRPADDVTYTLRIARPDATIDYKMLVKRPDLESAR